MEDNITTTNKSKIPFNILGFILSLSSILVCGILIKWTDHNYSRDLAPMPILLPVTAIIISYLGQKKAKKAGVKTGFGIAGVVIGIIALLWSVTVYFSLDYIEKMDKTLKNKIEQFEQKKTDLNN